jgi:hypothetical protein
VRFAAGAVRLLAQAELRITDPPNYTVVNPGQTVSVTAEASGGPFTSVIFITPDHTKVNGKAVLTSPPYKFSFTVSSSVLAPGIQGGGVLGTLGQGHVTADMVIDIERSDSPKAISVDRDQLELSVGDGLPIQVFGVYGDGAKLLLTKSTRTKYEVDSPRVIKVDASGAVTALAPGIATVIIHHLGLEATTRVKVLRQD